MKLKQILRTLLILAVLGTNIGCDQVSKSIVREKIGYNEHVSLIHGYVTLMKVENTGAFLSIGQSLPRPAKTLLLSIVPVIALVLGFIYLVTRQNLSALPMLGICFVLGGGIGNIYDRLLYQSVTDFLHIDFVIFQTGIFNMADVSVLTGALMILFDSFRQTNTAELKSN